MRSVLVQQRWSREGLGRPAGTPDRRTVEREAHVRAQAEQWAREEKVAGDAAVAWKAARRAHLAHEYLVRKQIDGRGLKQGAEGLTVPMTDGEMKIGGTLLVLLRDADGKLWNLQIIDGDGSKLFLPGRKKGLSFVEGLLDDGGAVLIGEGVATMKTLRATTSLTTVAAIDSGNLLAVATSVRSAHPEKPVIFAADNDHQLPRREKPLPNLGLVKARDAARDVCGVVVAPWFIPGEQGTDWNDVYVTQGKATARIAIEKAFADQGISPLLPATVKKAWTARADVELRQLSASPALRELTQQIARTARQEQHQARGRKL
jgi:putative DNA primase/helicase